MNARTNKSRGFRIQDSEFRIRPSKFDVRHLSAFTLIELLVVIAIIALLAGIGAPLLRGLNKSNAMVAANRQLLDDLAYARQRAINDHTTVFVVFVPPCPWQAFTPPNPSGDPGQLNQLNVQLTNMFGGQYTTYALFALRSIGDQPGRTSPRYLTSWRILPEGVFFATNKFQKYLLVPGSTPYTLGFHDRSFPVPTVNTNGASALLKYLAFNYQGQLVDANNNITSMDEVLPLARGSIFYARDAAGNPLNQLADVLETPPGNSVNNSNVIHIDWLTGRAHIELQTVQ